MKYKKDTEKKIRTGKAHGKHAKSSPQQHSGQHSGQRSDSHSGPQSQQSSQHQLQRSGKKSGPKASKPKFKFSPAPQIYGFHAVAAAWTNPERKVHALYATEAGLKTFQDMVSEANAQGLNRPEPIIIDKHALEHAFPQGAVHQGLALACDDLTELSVQDFVISADTRERSVFLILDQVTDPHNVGAITRSACAFGAHGLIVQRRHAPERHGVLAKTACGGIEHVPVAQETNLSRAIEELQEAGFVVIGLDERGTHPIQDWAEPYKHKPTKIALVLGAEGPGLRALVRDHCDSLVHLPTSGALSSLNVSNAAAVSLFALLQS
jgi:23S rRNA (guanosine2251-2'-O)-methyltransferase